MTFDALEVAMQMIAAIHPIVAAVQGRDADLALQIRRAASSVPLNIDEGSRRRGRDRQHLYRIAAGSACEVRTALRVAAAWQYVDPAEVAAADALADRVVAMLYRLGGGWA